MCSMCGTSHVFLPCNNIFFFTVEAMNVGESKFGYNLKVVLEMVKKQKGNNASSMVIRL